jgi:hypothetical protein
VHTVDPYNVYRSALRHLPSGPCKNLSAIAPRFPIFVIVVVGAVSAETLVSAIGSGNDSIPAS